MSMYESWISDIPYQFREKPVIDAIIRAVGRQLDGVKRVSRQLVEQTDIDTATGKNLDMLGDNVNMSRNNAYLLLNGEQDMRVDDGIYRNVLRFQVLKNNSDATYADIMKGLRLLWGDDVKISYSECTEEPASIIINIDEITTDETDPAVIRPMVIRAGGVKLFFRSRYRDRIDMSSWEKFGNITLTYAKYHRYNGAHRYNGVIRYAPDDYVFRNRYDGEFRYNGEIMYKADTTMYHEYDGSGQYYGQWQYGAFFARKVVELGDAVLLDQAKRKMLEMRFSGSNGWQIAGFAFGTGLESGKDYQPTSDMTGLRNEVYRKETDGRTKVGENTYRYTGGLDELEMNGRSISEIGLYDTDGMLLCIKTFPPKKKNKEAEMVFSIDDMC